MPLRTRPLQVPADVPRFVAMLNTVMPEPISEREFMEWEASWPADGVRERVAARDGDGRVIAVAQADHAPWSRPGKFSISVLVDPAHRRTGIGRQLADYVEEWALGHGATLLETMVRDHMSEAVDFAKKRGYEIDRHIFESTLDVPAFDESPFAGVVEAVEASGIRFFTLADEPGESTERRMYELNARTALDIPGYDSPQYPPYEQWHKWALESEDVRPDFFILAADGDRLAGMTAMGVAKLTGALWTHYTGVDPEYRGRQIALALKLLSVRTARRHGAPYMRTNNDSKNAPMLAVNRKLGYTPCPGEYRMRKTVK